MIICTQISMDLKLELSWAMLEDFEPLQAVKDMPPGLALQREQFSAFLKKYHTDTYGNWPLDFDKLGDSPRAVLEDMLFEFHSLYEHLANKTSIRGQGFHIGSAYFKRMDQFDRMHHYKPLQYRLPQLPKTFPLFRNRYLSYSMKRLGDSFPVLRRQMSPKGRQQAVSAFSAATNGQRNGVSATPLILSLIHI